LKDRGISANECFLNRESNVSQNIVPGYECFY
jgi:hypothetical protein